MFSFLLKDLISDFYSLGSSAIFSEDSGKAGYVIAYTLKTNKVSNFYDIRRERLLVKKGNFHLTFVVWCFAYFKEFFNAAGSTRAFT